MKRVLFGLIILAGCRTFALSPAADAPAAFKLSAEEQKILDLTNQAREKEKLPPLEPNPTLCEVARAHSRNMADKGELNHVMDGKTPGQRVAAAGYRYQTAGENIAYGDGVTLEAIFQGWMDSKPHRENILRPNYREIGIGLARNAKGEVYYTQVFGTALK